MSAQAKNVFHAVQWQMICRFSENNLRGRPKTVTRTGLQGGILFVGLRRWGDRHARFALAASTFELVQLVDEHLRRDIFQPLANVSRDDRHLVVASSTKDAPLRKRR